MAYAVLCQLHHTDTLFLFNSKPCGAADTEQHTPFIFSGYSPKIALGGDKLLNKVVIFFFCAKKDYG